LSQETFLLQMAATVYIAPLSSNKLMTAPAAKPVLMSC